MMPRMNMHPDLTFVSRFIRSFNLFHRYGDRQNHEADKDQEYIESMPASAINN